MLETTNSVKSLKAFGIHGRFDLIHEFHPGINILHGRNGTGKTTILHILANLLNGDFRRFAFLDFNSIELELLGGKSISLSRIEDDNEPCIQVLSSPDIPPDIISCRQAKQALSPASNIENSLADQRRVFENTYKNLQPILPTAYFPAFRTLIEAAGGHNDFDPYSDVRLRRRPSQQHLYTSTSFSRRFFGEFVPWINYPSPYEVAYMLGREALQAESIVALTDRELLSKAFLDIFSILSSPESETEYEDPSNVLEAIKLNFAELDISGIISGPVQDEEIYSRLREMIPSAQFRQGLEEIYVPVLQVYRRALEKRVQVLNTSSSLIKLFLDSVNSFLEKKRLVIRRLEGSPIPKVQVQFEDDSYASIQSLSSGERQIVTIIYSSTHMSDQDIVLIDEPEISLHIDWQVKLLSSIAEQLNGKQIITCTHSPVIASGHEDQMAELSFSNSSQRISLPTLDPEEIEDFI
jgi:predicted ATPase